MQTYKTSDINADMWYYFS